MGVFDTIGESIGQYGDKSHETCFFYHFEPWDVEKRPKWVIEQAQKDGIDLYADNIVKYIGTDPHGFQSQFLLDDVFFRSIVAGTSVGKSIVAFVESLIMLSGETPIALRHPAGTDTKIKRMITEDNIRRFGRFDSSSGKLIDRDTKALRPTSWDEWDCGTIHGVGVYPASKIAPVGSEIWLGTYMKAMNEYWWPRYHDNETKLMPDHFIDKTRGNDGFNVQDHVIYFVRGGKLSVITYESGYNRFEAQRVWACFCDEEPETEKILQAAQQHCQYLILSETPYRGITFSKDWIYPKELSVHKRVYHATQYDSPYQTRDGIKIKRESMKPWDVGARVWGFHSETTGKPYFDRMKIQGWMRKFTPPYQWMSFVPECEFIGMYGQTQFERFNPGLMEVGIRKIEKTEDDNMMTWRVYEEVKKGVPYVMSVDPAEGAEVPEAAADTCAAIVARAGEGHPVIVATIRSTLETVAFARMCALCLRYYNNALLAAETRRAACNATFLAELREYPYWYKMTSMQETTQQLRKIKGFDTNAATRTSVFDLIADWIGLYPENEYPEIPDEWLLRELAGCVVGKNGRPDHTLEGTLDTTLAFGIMLYVFKHNSEQIVYNGPTEDIREPFGKLKALMSKTQETSATKMRHTGLGEIVKNWRGP